MNEHRHVKILLIGTGVIGTVYGVALAGAGHHVSAYAYGDRFETISTLDLRAIDVETGKHFKESAAVVKSLSHKEYDLVLVSVRQEQLASTFPVIAELQGRPTILFFGNNPAG